MRVSINKKEQGFSALVLLLVAFAVVILFGLYIFRLVMLNKNTKEFMKSSSTVDNMNTGFEAMPNEESTPDEIDEDTMEELDSIMTEVDSDTTLDSDITLE